MPHDRRSARFLLAMTGLVGVAMSVGCMRSSNLRTAASSLPDLAPAGELHPVASGPGSGPSWADPTIAKAGRPAVDPPPGGRSASPPPGDASPDDPSTTASPPPDSPAPPDARPTSPDTSPTPLLDAEIRRAEAVTRQHIESLRAADPPTPVARPVVATPDRPASPTTAAPGSAPDPKPADPEPDLAALPPLADPGRIAVEPVSRRPSDEIRIPPLTPIDAAADRAASLTIGPTPRGLVAADVREVPPKPDQPDPGRSASEDLAGDPRPVAPPAGEATTAARGPAERSDQEDRPPLEIAALRLCSRVARIGQYEPVAPDTLRPGQRVMVYCEMTGLEYQAQGDRFVSRLAAHIELRSAADGSIAWEQAPGTALDLWHRPRRDDYFVSYRIQLPETLKPGPYRLRLIQTDLIGNRVAAREIPVTIVR